VLKPPKIRLCKKKATKKQQFSNSLATKNKKGSNKKATIWQQQEIDNNLKLVLKYGQLIEELPNYISVNSAGILILVKPIQYYSEPHLPSKGYSTVQFNMKIVDDVGVFKVGVELKVFQGMLLQKDILPLMFKRVTRVYF
jgi:DNA polymerase III alpha subunit